MTMGRHMMMKFRPAIFRCYIWSGNHSYELVHNSAYLTQLECTLIDDRLIDEFSLLICKVVKAHVVPVSKPKTLH